MNIWNKIVSWFSKDKVESTDVVITNLSDKIKQANEQINEAVLTPAKKRGRPKKSK